MGYYPLFPPPPLLSVGLATVHGKGPSFRPVSDHQTGSHYLVNKGQSLRLASNQYDSLGHTQCDKGFMYYVIKGIKYMGGRLPFRLVSPRCKKKDSRNTVYIVNMECGMNCLVQFWCTNRKTI